MAVKQKPTITIIGAGIAGLFLALQFAKRGFTVNVYEKYSKKEVIDFNSNRSFNLTFYQYGKDILQKYGIWNLLKNYIIVLDGSYTQITPHSKPIISKFDDGMPYFCITRVRLLDALLTKVSEVKNIKVHFGMSVLSINKYEKKILFQNIKTKKISEVNCDVIFGADGVNSLTRSFMQQGQESHHSQEQYDWTYKQIVFDETHAKQLGLEKKRMYAWTRENSILVAFPAEGGKYNGMLILPKKGKYTFDTLDENQITDLVTKEFPHLLALLPNVTKSLIANPQGRFVTVHTDPWYSADFIAIVGDAAHGFMPFYGQGISCAFGDCLCLMDLIDRYGTDWKKVFSEYQQNRKASMDALGEVSKESFLDYRRTRRADYDAIYTRVESIFHYFFPQVIKPHPFVQIATDPGNTFCILENHRKQREILNRFGVSIGVWGLTTLVYIFEELQNLLSVKVRFSN